MGNATAASSKARASNELCLKAATPSVPHALILLQDNGLLQMILRDWAEDLRDIASMDIACSSHAHRPGFLAHVLAGMQLPNLLQPCRRPARDLSARFRWLASRGIRYADAYQLTIDAREIAQLSDHLHLFEAVKALRLVVADAKTVPTADMLQHWQQLDALEIWLPDYERRLLRTVMHAVDSLPFTSLHLNTISGLSCYDVTAALLHRGEERLGSLLCLHGVSLTNDFIVDVLPKLLRMKAWRFYCDPSLTAQQLVRAFASMPCELHEVIILDCRFGNIVSYEVLQAIVPHLSHLRAFVLQQTPLLAARMLPCLLNHCPLLEDVVIGQVFEWHAASEHSLSEMVVRGTRSDLADLLAMPWRSSLQMLSLDIKEPCQKMFTPFLFFDASLVERIVWHCPDLTSFHLHHALNCNSLIALAQSIGTQLQELVMTGCNLSDGFMVYMLSHLRGLFKLNLVECAGIGDKTFDAVLTYCTTIRKIKILNCSTTMKRLARHIVRHRMCDRAFVLAYQRKVQGQKGVFQAESIAGLLSAFQLPRCNTLANVRLGVRLHWRK